MSPNKDAYEYISVYIDDLAIITRSPDKIVHVLWPTYNKFKLKGRDPSHFTSVKISFLTVMV
jgi:hypothetical protein